MQFKDTMITAGGLILQQFAAFVVGVYIARSIGAEDYGSLSIARNFSVILLTLTPLGLDLALLKYLPRIQSERRFTFNQLNACRALVYIANFVVVVISIVSSGFLQEYVYRFSSFAILFSITIAVIPFSADINILSTYYKTYNRPGVFSLLTSYFQTIFRSALCLLVLWLGMKAIGIAVATTFSAVVAVAIMSLHLIRWHRRTAEAVSSERRRDRSEIRTVLRESIWMAMNLFVYGASRSLDVIVLGMFVTSREVGSYGALSLIAYIVAVYPIALSQTLGPTVARLFNEGNMIGIRDILSQYIRLASIISSFIFAGIAAFGDRLDLLLGKSYEISPVLALLLPLGQLVSAILAPTGYALSMTGKHRLELLILVGGGLSLLILLFVLVPVFGAKGAALSVVFAFVINNVVRFIFVARHTGYFPGSYRDFIPPLLCLILAYASRAFVNIALGQDFIDITAGCILFAVIYAAITWAVLLRADERRKLLSKIVRRAS
jgi:O-antigen/teichoic acid export membrane protein